MTRLATMAAVLAMTSSACLGTETTNPPFDETINFENTQVFAMQTQGDPPDFSTRVGGDEGTVSPARGRLLARTLEGEFVQASASVASDGSFVLVLPVGGSQAFRLEHEFDGGLGTVAEMTFDPVGGLRRTANALPCLSLDTRALVFPEGGTSVTLRNDCDVVVERDRAMPRDPDSDVMSIDDGPLELAPGERVNIELMADGPRVRNVIVIPIRSPEVVLRAVSVRGPS